MSEKRSAVLRVALVGPCASGKSTIAAGLRRRGWNVRQPAQEHSGVPDMWLRLTAPDVLIYLDASLHTLLNRRPTLGFQQSDLAELERRLAHARDHADLIHSVNGESERDTIEILDSFLRATAADRHLGQPDQRLVPSSDL